MTDRILIVDDDEGVLALLESTLEKNGFRVLKALDGLTALRIAEVENPQIVLLDVELPCMSGAEVCRKLTKSPKFTGQIIMVSAHKKPKDQIIGLDCGASDYVTKPFDEGVLIAKIKVALRNSKEKDIVDTERCIKKGDFKLCKETRVLWLRGRKIAVLTGNEFKLFEKFLGKSPNCVSRDELLKEIDNESKKDALCLNVHVSNLRKKLGRTRSRIETVYGKGLRLIT